MDLRKEAARAALPCIHPRQRIGFGAGTSIRYLIEYLQAVPPLAETIRVFTSSFSTAAVLRQHGFRPEDPSGTDMLDVYFDGCDQLDSHLNALKSGGGIHTTEKIMAALAQEFILLGDASKYVEALDTRYPVVLEVLPPALRLVQTRLEQLPFVADTQLRSGDKKDGPVFTVYGNLLIDCHLQAMPALKELNSLLSAMPGVVEHSLFYNMATKAIIASEQGVVVKDK